MASLLKIWIVRYVDRDGHRVPKGTPGARKVKERSSVWYGQYKVDGAYRREPLFSDKEASRQRLADLVKGVERGEVGLVNPHKESLEREIEGHINDYMTHIRTQGLNPKHLSERERLVRSVVAGCGFKRLGDLSADKITEFLSRLQKKPTKRNPDPGPASARTKDTYRGAVHAFAQWCVETRPQRLRENPVSATAKPNGPVEHPRRAETVENLRRLLEVAAQRPLKEALTVRKGPRKGEEYADVRKDQATGHFFDFHALRRCTDTSLMAAGVAPSVVMLFTRHRTMKLSLVTYNDPRMTDARKALAALPKLF